MATIDFNIHSKPEIFVTQEEAICIGSSFHFSELNLFFNTLDSIHSLVFRNQMGQVLPTTNYTPDSSQDIIIQCETVHGCKDTSNMLLTVNDLPVINPGPPQAVCERTATLNAQIGANETCQWIGENSAFISEPNNPNASVTISDYNTYYFTLEVTNQNGCKNQATTSIDFDFKSDLFSADFYIDKNPIFVGEDVRLINISKDDDNTKWWDFGNGFTSTTHSNTISYNSEGLYDVTLVIENFNGCTDSITKQILALPFLTVNIPNSFTPNDDQVNDLFEVLGNGILNYDIKVFNRWGEELYTSKNKGWDGTYKNTHVQDGSYTYQIIVEDFKKKNHHFYGQVFLIR